MRFSILAGALVLGLLIGARARADMRALDEAELKDLARVAAFELKSCADWAKVKEASEPSVMNKSAEHIDKKLLSSELVSRLGEQVHWVDSGEKVPAIELELGFNQQESAQSIVSHYELKIALKGGGVAGCEKSVRLEKRLEAAPVPARADIGTGSVCLGPYLGKMMEKDGFSRLAVQVDDAGAVHFDRKEPRIVAERLDPLKAHRIRIYWDGKAVETWPLRFDQLKTRMVMVWRAAGSWRMDPAEKCAARSMFGKGDALMPLRRLKSG